ncbi:HIT family protein [Saccharomonospora marina]|nr:histidine triad (HIT) protein [Saccharomonospora marina]
MSDLVVVSHRPVEENGRAFPGYLFVECRRHVPSLDLLEPEEVEAIARASWALARGLRSEVDCEAVYSAIVGRTVAHFHQHVFVRHRGTPRHIDWFEGHLWPHGPRASRFEIEELCTRLCAYLR